MTILTEVKNIERWSEQTRAVATYLEKHGEVDNFTALSVGIPPVGRVLRLGARIWDLRNLHGYQIATEQQPDKNTVYRLIRAPHAQQLSLV
jgi:Helix-turn-helix domain